MLKARPSIANNCVQELRTEKFAAESVLCISMAGERCNE